jgi:2-phospho-L-lactate/phosphoenolpyruvate guanylyltransferase
MKISALIPVKNFRNAKQRLSRLLPAAERQLFAELMFRDVLRNVIRARGLAASYVVTADEQVANIAVTFGARVIREKTEKGETEAVDFARLELARIGCEAILIVPADMPLLRSEDIEQIVAQLPPEASPPFALLVPSHDRLGTNALLLAPPDVIKLRFGHDSYTYHMSQVSARGLPLRFFDNERIALDIDEPKDLERFLALGDETSESFSAAQRLVQAQRAQKRRRSGGA